jgi:hypothetical protein
LASLEGVHQIKDGLFYNKISSSTGFQKAMNLTYPDKNSDNKERGSKEVSN